MEQRVEAIREGKASELVWLLEHPPLYTLGTSGRAQDILRKDVPIFETGRGGQVTFHGPGQRVIYVLLDLSQRGQDLRSLYLAIRRVVNPRFKKFKRSRRTPQGARWSLGIPRAILPQKAINRRK